jgi:hypothetical protein
MRIIRSAIAFMVVFATMACNQSETPAPTPSRAAASAPSLWFICDGIDAPSVFVLEKDASGARVTLTEYNKAAGAEIARHDFGLGAPEGAAGSVYTPLLQDGAQAGYVRAFNPGMLETPGAAYTPPVTSVSLGERNISCRWLARTRLVAFSNRRSIAINEDADGDLIYTTFNFAEAGGAQPIELSDGARSTSFSLEVRGGEELVQPDGAEYRFQNGEHTYVVTVPRDGAAKLEVLRNDRLIQTEALIAVQTGAGGE